MTYIHSFASSCAIAPCDNSIVIYWSHAGSPYYMTHGAAKPVTPPSQYFFSVVVCARREEKLRFVIDTVVTASDNILIFIIEQLVKCLKYQVHSERCKLRVYFKKNIKQHFCYLTINNCGKIYALFVYFKYNTDKELVSTFRKLFSSATKNNS